MFQALQRGKQLRAASAVGRPGGILGAALQRLKSSHALFRAALLGADCFMHLFCAFDAASGGFWGRIGQSASTPRWQSLANGRWPGGAPGRLFAAQWA
jgi:hypothetical protein